MRVLVTGATGFVGRRLAKALCEAGMDVKALSRRHSVDDLIYSCPDGKITPLVADLSRATSFIRACDDVDSIFHLAGYAHAVQASDESSGAIHRQVTVEGTRALLEYACCAGVQRFVFASTVKAMGEDSKGCIDETAPALAVTDYGRAKLEAEQLVMAAGRNCGMHVCILRLPMVYGPGVKGNLLHMINAIDRGRFPPLPDVHNKRSMVHVDDVVQALSLAVENPKANGEVYLVTDGRAYSTYEICVLIRRALGRADPKWNVPIGVLRAAAGIGDAIGRIRGRPFFFNGVTLNKLIGSAWYSSEKIERDLGFKPTQTLETALPAIVAEYRKSGRAA